MFVSKVRLIGDPILRTTCEAVEVFDASVRSQAKTLLKSLTSNDHGIGLAANQIGLTLRMFAYEEDFLEERAGVICNPRIVEKSGSQIDDEGCLSIPNLFWERERFEHVIVVGQTPEGDQVTYEAEGLVSRLVQHEIDHLDGKLFIDGLPREQRKAINEYLAEMNRISQRRNARTLGSRR